MANPNPVDAIKEQSTQTARKVVRQPWVDPLIRLGYAARGLVYGLIGLLAFLVVFGGKGKITNQQGVLETLAQNSAGRILLIIMTVGLAGYALWGLIRAALDPMGKGDDTKGVLTRLGYLISGISYAALFVFALNILAKKPIITVTGGGGGSQSAAAANIMTRPWGPWLILAIGLGIIIAAVIQIRTGLESDFEMRFKPYAMSARQRHDATQLGRFGYVARGIVFAIIGIYLFRAGLYHNASQVVGVDGALRVLANLPYGFIILAVIALGLMAFGVYSLLGAAWFRVKRT